MKMNCELMRNLLFDFEVLGNGKGKKVDCKVYGWDWEMCIKYLVKNYREVECGIIRNYEKNVMVIFYKKGNRLKMDDLGNWWKWD